MIRTAEDRAYLVELDQGVLRLSFNRPEYGNAVAAASVADLTALFEEAKEDPSVRVILVRGEGAMFSAGGDVAGFARSLKQDKETRQADFAERLPRLGKLVQAVIALDKPMVAAIRGAVAGAGLLFPLTADVVIGEPDAVFAFAHQRIGLSPDGGVTVLLPQAVGVRAARRLLLTAAKVDADEALKIGLLDEIVAAGTLEEQSMKVARRFAKAPQRAIRTAKRLLAASANGGGSLSDRIAAETAGIIACVGEDDFDEGVRAFIEKRPASFPSAG
jgi:2-(1,2-epoxy-1,2-dihydrophenyl)acetyl-CoA isomerase